MQSKKVIILMTTFNGEQFLNQQLDSIINQDFSHFDLYISDDGSTDNTLSILHNFKSLYPLKNIVILNGPKKGFANNFLFLCHYIQKNIDINEATYFAFADQDDIWHPDKLSAALLELKKCNHSVPALFCSRTRLVDENGLPYGFSPLFQKPPSFKNALVQNIAGGNTMVFDKNTLELLVETPEIASIVSHDWWTYLLVTATGGQVIYSSIPKIDYRQHFKNVIGSNRGFNARLERFKGLFKGKLKHWNTSNLENLSLFFEKITPENLKIVQEFKSARNTLFPLNILKFNKLGLYRQGKDNLALKLAVILNKV